MVGDFEDTYENLPTKTFLGYQFLNDQCNGKFAYTTFTDDDTLLDLKNITTMMEEFPAGHQAMRCLKGRMIDLDRFSFSGKYFVWRESWKDGHVPPQYCNGQCNAMTSSAAKAIFREAQTTDRNNMRLEDVYFAGILRAKANVTDIKNLDGNRGFCRHLAGAMNKKDLFETQLQSLLDGTLHMELSA